MPTTLTEELVLAVIRGQLPLSALESAGIRLEVAPQGEGGNERRVTVNPEAAVTVAPRPVDIAAGLLVYKERPEQLRDWAAFVLGASEIIDLEGLDNWPEGDAILNALWDASFEGKVSQETLRIAVALVED